MMKKETILGTIPELFSIRGHDYSRFLVQGGAERMMKHSLEQVNATLNASIRKAVAHDVKRVANHGSTREAEEAVK